MRFLPRREHQLLPWTWWGYLLFPSLTIAAWPAAALHRCRLPRKSCWMMTSYELVALVLRWKTWPGWPYQCCWLSVMHLVITLIFIKVAKVKSQWWHPKVKLATHPHFTVILNWEICHQEVYLFQVKYFLCFWCWRAKISTFCYFLMLVFIYTSSLVFIYNFSSSLMSFIHND